MLGINSNINSLIAQQNLSTSGSALSQAITRLSSGKRINSAADDAAGLAISNRMQTQINGLNQGVSNANEGVSMIQTANSGLAQITSSLQRIRQLAVQASSGSLSSTDQAALQQEVSAQVSEVNRVASQTTYNGKSVLDGTAGSLSFQIGANAGQTINLNLTQNVSTQVLGGGSAAKGTTLGTVDVSALKVDTTGAALTATDTNAQLTSISVIADGSGGYSFTDQNNTQITSTGVLGSVFAGVAGATVAGATTGSQPALTLGAAMSAALGTGASLTTAQTQIGTINADNNVPLVSNINISTTNGASAAMESIDAALATVNNIQASLGAAQNRFTAIATTQQAVSTNLSGAQSQITDANFAQETANLSKAQVMQQAGISVLAQANSNPQQVLKLLQ